MSYYISFTIYNSKKLGYGPNNNMENTSTKNEKIWKFDGRHVNIKVFNRTIITELKAKNRLAAAILRGNIAVKETRTLMGSI